MAREVGVTRCYAIASADKDVVRAFGGGVYGGYRKVPEGRGFLGIEGLENVCIDLDSGETVFGHECWWGDEEAALKAVGNRKIKLVTIADYYKKDEDESGSN